MTTAKTTESTQRLTLNAELVHARRVTLGLSGNVLAKMLGISSMVIDWIEHDGKHGHQSLDFVSDLAAALGLNPRDLVADRSDHREPTAPDDVEDSDPAIVGQNLATVGRVHIDELARSLGWTSGRVRWALHLLDDRLAAVGQCLAWVADTEVQVIAVQGPATVAERLGKRNLRARGMAENDARMFHQLLTAPTQPAVFADAIALNRLIAAGLATTDVIARTDRQSPTVQQEGPRVTESARYNCYLT